MRYSGKATVIIGLLAIMAADANAGGDTAAAGRVTITGSVELETAEMLKARITYSAKYTSIEHAWYSHMLGNLGFDAVVSQRMRVTAGFEFRSYMNMSPTCYDMEVNSSAYNLGDLAYSEFFLREAQGIFSLFREGATSVELALGYMPYKYSQDVRSLGEFLFRSGTYPFYLLGEFDRPFARITGARLGVSTGNDIFGWKFDWLVMTERQYRPFWDISIAAIAGFNVTKAAEFGAGVDFSHCIPMNSDITTPKGGTGYSPYVLYNKDSTQTETGSYTFKGTKLMAHASVDPFWMARGGSSILGEILGRSGGKIYGEIAVIGFEDYPANAEFDTSITESNPYGYASLKEKSPWMVGITIPMWKILDECAFELERYPNPAPNSTAYLLLNGSPMPFYKRVPQSTSYGFGVYKPRWYWTLYMKKQIVSHCSAVCQVGREHVQWELPMIYQTANYDYEDCMVKPDEWGWHFKMVFGF